MNIKIENLDKSKINVKIIYDKKTDTYRIIVFPKIKIKKETQFIMGLKNRDTRLYADTKV